MASVFGPAAIPLIACIALLAAAILQILGFAAPYWSHNGIQSRGLWRNADCLQPAYWDCYQYDQTHKFVPDWMHAVRAMESCGIIFIVLPLVILPVYMYIALGMYYKCMMGTMCASALLSVITIIVGVVVYAINSTALGHDIQWCLIVCIVAAACAFIAFLVLLVALVQKRPEALKEVYVPAAIYIHPDKPKLYTIRMEED